MNADEQRAERDAFDAVDRRLEVRGAWFGGFALGALVAGLVIAAVLIVLSP